MQPILKIDLSTGKTEEYRIPEKWEKDFLGGASLAARILYSTPLLQSNSYRDLQLVSEQASNIQEV